MFKKLLFSFCLVYSFTFLHAQQIIPCASDEFHREIILKDPLAKAREDKANELIRAQVNTLTKKGGGIIYIPVVFHIISNSVKDSAENITQAQIMDQIRILNEDFRKRESTPGFSSDPVAADMQIEFRLAQYDPNGKKHDGIVRINSPLTSDARDNVKALSYWDSNKYLNVWVVKSINSSSFGGQGIVLGYAQFPSDQSSQPTTDGVVVRSDQIGAIGTGQVSQGGRTLTHEIGHWLSLYHTFQGGCVGGTSSNCNSQGDQICDTPPVNVASSGCNTGQNSCNNDVPNLPDMIKNYMDYSDGSCMNTYTTGQKNRVYAALSLYRNTIYGNGTNNISYAGIDVSGNYLPVPASNIKPPLDMTFDGNSFNDNKWQIQNFGNPLNGWQLNTNVSANGGSCMYIRNFNNFTSRLNARDAFQSPEYNLSSLAVPYVEFQYAFAQRASFNTDSLILYITDDFGMTEQRIFGKSGTDLATAPLTTSEFIPTADQWKKASINITAYKKYTHARFRIEFFNRRGNNVYVDEFKITNWPTGIENAVKQDIEFNVFPNPMNETATISFNLKENTYVNITLLDITGKEIMPLENETLTSGKKVITIQNNKLKPGIYLIHFQSNQGSFSHKLLVH